ncbi:MAG: hypothetical protein ACK4VN_16390 [Bacteroidales bacterium]
MEQKSFFENISEIRESLKTYLETHIAYYGMSALEKTVKALTILISNGFVLLLMGLALIFFSASAALYIGTLLDSIELGLLITGGFYLFLGSVFYAFRTKIFSPIIIKVLVGILFKDDDDEQEPSQKR